MTHCPTCDVQFGRCKEALLSHHAWFMLLYGMITTTSSFNMHIIAGLHGKTCHKARQQMSANDAAGMPAKVD